MDKMKVEKSVSCSPKKVLARFQRNGLLLIFLSFETKSWESNKNPS